MLGKWKVKFETQKDAEDFCEAFKYLSVWISGGDQIKNGKIPIILDVESPEYFILPGIIEEEIINCNGIICDDLEME